MCGSVNVSVSVCDDCTMTSDDICVSSHRFEFVIFGCGWDGFGYEYVGTDMVDDSGFEFMGGGWGCGEGICDDVGGEGC